MDKNILRQDNISKRKALSQDTVKELSLIISNSIIHSKAYEEADTILAYWSARNEVHVEKVLADALSKGKKVFLPRCISKTEMIFLEFKGLEDLEKGHFGIMEPITNTEYSIGCGCFGKMLMLVPGVAFDREGDRLGYGAGYYDRYLSQLEKVLSAVKGDFSYHTFGVSYEMQLTEDLPTEPTDFKLDCVVTEKGFYE